MARRNLAARSLRHLRFARRMMAGQPLLARAFHRDQPAAHIMINGHHLPVGHVLRHLPQSDNAWIDDPTPGMLPPSDASAPPAETLLRLLPRLPELYEPHGGDASDEGGPGEWLPPQSTPPAETPRASRPVESAPETPPAQDNQPPISTRHDDRRPRSRIVELPGTFSLPVESEASGEDAPPDTETLADAQTAESLAPLPTPETHTISTADATTPETAQDTPPATAPRRRGSKRAASPPPHPSDGLFPPTDADRSPQAWLARLREAGNPTAPTPPAAKPDDEQPAQSGQHLPRQSSHTTDRKGEKPRATNAQSPQQPARKTEPSTLPLAAAERPAVLPDSSRTLLHSMTGVDPVGVRVYRGPVAERATAAQNADALTDGATIALGAGHATDTPETLGLLAHELTHVGQRHNARFVPPIAQMSTRQQRAHAAPNRATPFQVVASSSEEVQAAWVEAQVTDAASAQVTDHSAGVPAEPLQPIASAPPTYMQPPLTQERGIWGNLPAPWEPLPEWMTNPASTEPTSRPASSAHPSSAASPRAPSPNGPSTQRAERGRAMPTTETEAAHAPSPHEGGVPEPDLDALAQQVHAILKRRLAAERRRFG